MLGASFSCHISEPGAKNPTSPSAGMPDLLAAFRLLWGSRSPGAPCPLLLWGAIPQETHFTHDITSLIYWKPDATKACACHFLCPNLFHNSILKFITSAMPGPWIALKSRLFESCSLNWSITSFALVFRQKLSVVVYINQPRPGHGQLVVNISISSPFSHLTYPGHVFVYRFFSLVVFLNNPWSLRLPPAPRRGIEAWATWHQTGPLTSEAVRQVVQREYNCRLKHISTCYMKGKIPNHINLTLWPVGMNITNRQNHHITHTLICWQLFKN